MSHSRFKIILSGGGTLGSVTPLLGLAGLIRQRYPEVELQWVGTETGPEKTLVEEAQIDFVAIPSGKWRRYSSWENVRDFWRVTRAFFVSLKILWQTRPQVCISAGGYVSVPLHFAAWLMGIPTWIHQLDVRVGLANRLMAPFARVITTGLPETVQKFKKNRAHALGNPVRTEMLEGTRVAAQQFFKLQPDRSTVLFLGGGTGAERLNELAGLAAPFLLHTTNIIHLTGTDRPRDRALKLAADYPDRYYSQAFLGQELRLAYALADVVVCRGGFGTLTELAALAKPAVVVPKMGHQVDNVVYFHRRNGVVALDERLTDGDQLSQTVLHFLQHPAEAAALGNRLHALAPPVNRSMFYQLLDNLLTNK